MRIAVMSDIHGNLEALQEVLADMDRSAVDARICLGDMIGYGPDPNRVLQLIDERHVPSVIGNHELGAVDSTYLNWFNPSARNSLVASIRTIEATALASVRRLPKVIVRHGARFVHGFPPDSPLIYAFQVSEEEIKQAFRQTSEKICFIGHTHLLEIISFDGQALTRSDLQLGRRCLCAHKRYIINIGSVGQPRDGDNHAKYVIWDTTRRLIEVKFVAYDIAAVVKKIRAAGLPEINARRLL